MVVSQIRRIYFANSYRHWAYRNCFEILGDGEVMQKNKEGKCKPIRFTDSQKRLQHLVASTMKMFAVVNFLLALFQNINKSLV